MKMKFKLRKLYEGNAAVDFVRRIKSRTDLDNPVLSGSYYELDDKRIVEAYWISEYHPKYGYSPELFPRFMAFKIYNSEKEFWEKMEQFRDWMKKDGRVPPPLRYPKKGSIFLHGESASQFLKNHEDLGVGFYGWVPGDLTHYFKNKSGQITNAHVWLEANPVGPDEPNASPGPWVQTVSTYESEDHAKEWRDYYLDRDDGTKNHLLYPYLLNKPNWPEELSQWQAFLAGKLKIPIAQLDFSLESCELLETQRQKLKISYKRYLKDFFAPCLGYLYEVARRHKNGTWEMRPAPAAPTVFEPFIKLEGGGEMHFFVEYWDWVYEDYENFSLSAMAQMAVEDF